MHTLFCDYFRTQYGGPVLRAVLGGECDEYTCNVIGWVVNSEWLDLWSAFCGWGAW